MNNPAVRSLIALAIAFAAAGCVHAPAVRATLPERIAASGKAIAVLGDLQQTPAFVRFVRRKEHTATEQARLIADLQARSDELAALVVVGDLVYSARSSRDWAHFDTLVAPFADRMAVLPAIGNHDYPCFLVRLCRTSKIARDMHARFPWLEPGEPYSVQTEDLLMLFLDSESRLEAQGAWLRAQLDAAPDAHSAVLVFFHRPAYSNSVERTSKGNDEVERIIVPALRGTRIPTVVFNGHIHGFERFERDGLHFVTTAGGGGPRVAMPAADSVAADAYAGPQCTYKERVFRPFNYVLVRSADQRLTIEVHGFCRGDDAVKMIDSFDIPL